MIHVVSKRDGEKLISAIQLNKGLRKGEMTYLTTLKVETKEPAYDPVPDAMCKVLDEFNDMMPKELPMNLPSRRAIDHQIEINPGAKPFAKAPYWMALPELTELQKQLDGLLEAGFSRRIMIGALDYV